MTQRQRRHTQKGSGEDGKRGTTKDRLTFSALINRNRFRGNFIEEYF